MRGSKFPADMHNTIWCPIYIPSFMKIGSVVSEEVRWQDFGTDGRTDGLSDCTPRPTFAFSDAGKNVFNMCLKKWKIFEYLFPKIQQGKKIFVTVLKVTQILGFVLIGVNLSMLTERQRRPQTAIELTAPDTLYQIKYKPNPQEVEQHVTHGIMCLIFIVINVHWSIIPPSSFPF